MKKPTIFALTLVLTAFAFAGCGCTNQRMPQQDTKSTVLPTNEEVWNTQPSQNPAKSTPKPTTRPTSAPTTAPGNAGNNGTDKNGTGNNGTGNNGAAGAATQPTIDRGNGPLEDETTAPADNGGANSGTGSAKSGGMIGGQGGIG